MAAETSRLTELSRSIAGRTAIVTGAASGMGRATAHLFADEGASVVVADLGPERVQRVVDEIALGARRRGVCWGSCATSPIRSSSMTWSRRRSPAFGGIDIVVNNAGVALPTSLFEVDELFESHWATTLDVNLTAQARLVRLALPALIASDAGRVVNIASTEAIVTTAGMAAYSRHQGRGRRVDQEHGGRAGSPRRDRQLRLPGSDPDRDDRGDPRGGQKQTYARRRVPLRRYGSPEEVAHMTLNLCLPSASFVNGAIIPVDGGMTIRHT